MTLPDERIAAIVSAHALLRDLLDRSYRPGWRELRARAYRTLKHHPSALGLSLMLNGSMKREHALEARRLADREDEQR